MHTTPMHAWPPAHRSSPRLRHSCTIVWNSGFSMTDCVICVYSPVPVSVHIAVPQNYSTCALCRPYVGGTNFAAHLLFGQRPSVASASRSSSPFGFMWEDGPAPANVVYVADAWVRGLTRSCQWDTPRWCRSRPLAGKGCRLYLAGGGCLDAGRLLQRQNVRVIPHFWGGISHLSIMPWKSWGLLLSYA